jgi:hypothetical protein
LRGTFWQDPAVGRNKDGRLEVLVSGGSRPTTVGFGDIYHTYQKSANNGWIEKPIQFIRRKDETGKYISCLDYYHDSDGGPWISVSVSDKRGKIKLINNDDERLSAVALGDDSLYHAYQTAPSNGWNDYPWKYLYGHHAWPPA